MADKNRGLRGIVFVILSAFFFAIEYLLFDAIFQRSDISPQSALFWSLLTTELFVLPFFLFRKKHRRILQKTMRKDGKAVLLVSIISSLGIYLVFWGVAESNSGIISLLHETKLIFIPLLGVLLLKEVLTWSQIIGIITAILGFVCISNLKGEVSVAVVFAVVFSAFLYSLQSLFTKKYAPDLSGPSFSFLRAVLISVLLGIAMIFTKDSFAPPSMIILAMLFIAGFFGTFVSQIFYFGAHNLLPISTLNIFALAQPVFVVTGSTLFLNAPVSFLKGFGVLLIIVGLCLVMHGHMNKQRKEPSK